MFLNHQGRISDHGNSMVHISIKPYAIILARLLKLKSWSLLLSPLVDRKSTNSSNSASVIASPESHSVFFSARTWINSLLAPSPEAP